MLWMWQEQSQQEGHTLAPQENGLGRHFLPKSPNVRLERRTSSLLCPSGWRTHRALKGAVCKILTLS